MNLITIIKERNQENPYPYITIFIYVVHLLYAYEFNVKKK